MLVDLFESVGVMLLDFEPGFSTMTLDGEEGEGMTFGQELSSDVSEEEVIGTRDEEVEGNEF